jgi:hypothetical protein
MIDHLCYHLGGHMLAYKRSLARNNHGIAAVEFALILPVLLAILLGVLEFGVYFTKSSVVSRAVSSTSTAIQMSPTAANLQTDAQNSGFGLVNFTGNNFFCALSYSNRDAAGNYCTAGQWFTGAPAGHQAGTPYYVAIVASVRNQPISGITSFLPDMVVRNIVQVGGASGVQPHGMLRVGHPNVNNTVGSFSWPAISGSWVVPEGVTTVKATLVGGGQGGFGSSIAVGLSGTGGNSGGVLIAQIEGLTPGQSLPYIVGSGGQGATSSGVQGQAGGATSFNGLSASAGSLLGSETFGTSVTQGSVVATMTFRQMRGGYRMLSVVNNDPDLIWIGGDGADTPFGFGMGGQNATSGSQNVNAQGYGAGGAGMNHIGAGSTYGGVGAPGLLILEW